MSYSLRSVLKGSSVYTTGEVLVRATGFFLIPIYTRFLTPDDYGVIGLLSVVIVLMSSVLTLGLPQAQTRFYHEFHEDRQKVGELLFVAKENVYALSGTHEMDRVVFPFPYPQIGL